MKYQNIGSHAHFAPFLKVIILVGSEILRKNSIKSVVKPNLDCAFSCMHLCMHENARADAQCKLSYCMSRKLFYDPCVSQNLDAPFRTCSKSDARMHAGFVDLLSPNDTNTNLANGKR